MSDNSIENVLAGCFIAICTAIGPERTALALDTLSAFINDSRTPAYERQAYQDLIACLAMELSGPRPGDSIFAALVSPSLH